jgi:hypothetical protein
MPHSGPLLLIALALVIPCMAQLPRAPDVEAQRAAMRKLSFLVGKWSGEASVLRGPGGPPPPAVELAQTEEAQYKLDGLVLVIEGTGRTKAGGQVVLQALGLISFDDQAGTYRMRAYNDGRWLETEVALAEGGHGITWGFALGEIKTSSLLRINDKGEWTELGEITIGSQPPRPFMKLTVRPQK